MAGNYSEVLAQLADAGLVTSHLNVGTAKPVRCKVRGERGKPGWYKLHVLPLDDGDVIVGSYGIWHGDDPGTIKVDLGDRKLGKDQNDALKKRLAADRKKAEAELRRAQEQAARHATRAWGSDKLTATGHSDYLVRKRVNAHGVKFTALGEVVVPLHDDRGAIHGLQFIRTAEQAKQRNRPDKEFWPTGLAIIGHYCMLGDPATSWIILVAEGYATAASAHEATGYPVAVVFNANNIGPTVEVLHKRYRGHKLLLLADDDDGQKCLHCKGRLFVSEHPETCPHCGEPHRKSNAGVTQSKLAAFPMDNAAWVAPQFPDAQARRDGFLEHGRKLTDFNDLHAIATLTAVGEQIHAKLAELGWREPKAQGPEPTGGGGNGLQPIQRVDQLLQRYALIYGGGGVCFDRQEHIRVANSDVRDACAGREIHRDWMEHPQRSMVRQEEVGFDPTETKPHITCNLWGGWPTEPAEGNCDYLLDLLLHMCGHEKASQRDLYHWVLCWLAYPIQHPGAKMKTCLVIHGPQGTGKNLFFETVLDIYGNYGRVIGQAEIEDKFNDWASKMLFMLADEVVARHDLWQVKNKLKAFITGDRIRINPKGFSAYDESNHCNVVFLSNEAMPVVLEEDDRRHAVIWTPSKLDPGFYEEVKRELREGGAAALHHYLLHYDLGNFNPGTPPPNTAARQDLIDQGLDSTTRFLKELFAGDILDGVAIGPFFSQDLFDLYKAWCRVNNHKPSSSPRLFARCKTDIHNPGAKVSTHFINPATLERQQRNIVMWDHQSPPAGLNQGEWLGKETDRMHSAVAKYTGDPYA